MNPVILERGALGSIGQTDWQSLCWLPPPCSSTGQARWQPFIGPSCLLAMKQGRCTNLHPSLPRHYKQQNPRAARFRSCTTCFIPMGTFASAAHFRLVAEPGEHCESGPENAQANCCMWLPAQSAHVLSQQQTFVVVTCQWLTHGCQQQCYN